MADTNSGTPAQGPESTPSTVDQLTSLLSDDFGQDNTIERDVEQGEQGAGDETGETVDTDEQETGDDDTGGVEDAGDEVDTDPEEGEVDEEAETEAPLTVTVVIDGKSEELPLEEVAKGYQRNQDYTRKTQALSQARQEFEAEQAAVRQERANYAQLLPALQAQISQAAQANLPADKAAWDKLYEENPFEYMRARELQKEYQTQWQAAQAEQQRLASEAAQEHQTKRQKVLQENHQKMMELRPEWKKPEVWKKVRTEIMEHGAKLGFSAEELANAADARAIIALHESMLYRKSVQAKGQLKPTPRVVRHQPKIVGRRIVEGRPEDQARPASQERALKQRLAKTGKAADAAPLFEKFID